MASLQTIRGLLRCDCEGLETIRRTILWANQHGDKTRYFCTQCYAYVDLTYLHKALGEINIRHGFIEKHRYRTVDKMRCDCGNIRSPQDMFKHTITITQFDPKALKWTDLEVERLQCERCHQALENHKKRYGKTDDIPF